ncbi:hypothetical protein BASA61_004167 [Batrachochytrium salamandrivorans]|nr:hypothetical protein BASA61_004167 [Batrachochytrium salamandrivorans]
MTPCRNSRSILSSTELSVEYTRLATSQKKQASLAIDPTTPYRMLEFHGRFNHLFPSPDGRSALFVDDAQWICVAQVADGSSVQVTKLHALGAPSVVCEASTRLHLPPSIVFASSDIMIASDGIGSLEVFRVSTPDCTKATRLGSINIPQSFPTDGMLIWEACMAPAGDLILCIQRSFGRDKVAASGTTPYGSTLHRPDPKQLRFLVELVTVNLETLDISVGMTEDTTVDSALADPISIYAVANIVLSLQGDATPYFTQIEPDTLSLTVGAATPFELLDMTPSNNGTGILNADMSLIPGSPNEVSTKLVDLTHSHPLYSWRQADDEITVHVRLPSDAASKSNIRVVYQPSFVSIKLIHGNVELFSGDLFDRIHPSECIWTLEGPQQITLYIQKNRSGIRWPHLFAVDDAVLETLDDATLTEYTDRLEKYHQQTQTPPLGQRSTVTDASMKCSAVFDDPCTHFQTVTERQENIDFEASAFTIVRASASGDHGVGSESVQPLFYSPGNMSASTTSAIVTHQCRMPGMSWIGMQLPLPLENGLKNYPSILVKFDVDALVFKMLSELNLEHVATVSALAFVQASKQDKKFVKLTREMDLALIVESKKYMYVYERPAVGQANAKQFVVNIGGDDGGVDGKGANGLVLGVAQIGRTHVLVLTEDTIVAVRI